jgi:hypothetical protein
LNLSAEDADGADERRLKRRHVLRISSRFPYVGHMALHQDFLYLRKSASSADKEIPPQIAQIYAD